MSIIADLFKSRRWLVIHRAYKIRKYVHYLMRGLEDSAFSYYVDHMQVDGWNCHGWPTIRERFKHKRYMK